MDLPRIREAGYTHIQLRPQWRWHEAVRGQYDWNDIAQLFDLAEKHALRVVLKPMLETAPDWVFQELNGTRIGFHGVPITPFAHGAYYVGGWWPCFENPAVRQAAIEFTDVLVREFKEHPALWLYDAWNEPRSRPIESCQCPHCTQAYQNWLQERFGSIKSLNDFYGKRWTSFETIRPPVSGHDYVEMALWREWAAISVTGTVRSVTEQIRHSDSSRPVMFHRGSLDVITDIAWDAGDDVANAQSGCDWYGYSCAVEFHPVTPIDYALVGFQGDWMRRVDPKNWCHEFYPREAEWQRSPDLRHLKQQSLMTLSAGTKGFTWWQYRSERVGNESNGYGLVEINGESSNRSDYAAKLGKILQQHGKTLLESSAPKAPVAILHDRASDMVSRMSIFGNYFSRLPEGAKVSPYKKALRAAHALHWMHNVERDIVLPGDDLSGYRFLHVSVMEIMVLETAKWLTNFVTNGGFLFVEYPFACRDVNTWVSSERPNCGLSALLGCTEADRIEIDHRGEDWVNWPEAGTIQAAGMRCDFEVQSGKVLARWADDKPAVVMNQVGQGTVLTSGLNLALSSEDGTNLNVRAAFQQILGWAEIQPLLPFEYCGHVICQRRIVKNGQINFLYNLQEESAKFPERFASAHEDWLGELEATPSDQVLLPGKETWVGFNPISAGATETSVPRNATLF